MLIFMEANSPELHAIALRHLADMEAPFTASSTLAATTSSASAASTALADVLVELDGDRPAGIRRLHMQRAPAGRARAQRIEDLGSPVLAELPEGATPLEERLASFLIWGLKEYPAEHQLVIVGGRGLGWDPAKAPAIARALERASREAAAGRPFSIYASDACLMQTLEVATEVATAARFVVGSEQAGDYLGLPYRAIIPRINGTITPTTAPSEVLQSPRAIARAIPALTAAAFREGGLYASESDEAKRAFTISAIDTEALAGEVAPAFGALSKALVDYVVENDFRAIDLAYAITGTPGFKGGERDTGLLLARLMDLVDREDPRTELVEAARSAIVAADRAIGNVVIESHAGEGYDPGMRGVSIWVPHDRAELEARAAFFEPAKFFLAAAKGGAPWRAWIDKVLAEPPPPPPRDQTAPPETSDAE